MAFYDDLEFLLVQVNHLWDEGETSSPPGGALLGVGVVPRAHRRRSNTAEKLERLRRERLARAKTRTVRWKDGPKKLTGKDLSEVFPKKDLSVVEKSNRCAKSVLSETLELFPSVPNNPFGDYARFDGRFNLSAALKRVRVFPALQSKKTGTPAIEVICLCSARIRDLIGLVCWMYTKEMREPKLNGSVSDYCLKIAEETGEVDDDFPSLDANELIGKYGFPYLALIEKDTKLPSLLLTIYTENDLIQLNLSSLDLSVGEAIDFCQNNLPRNTDAYHIENIEQPGVIVSLNRKLSDYTNLKFRLIFEKEDAKERNPELLEFEYDFYTKVVRAPLYRSFTVTMHQKLGINYDVQLGISGEKIEIDPLPPKGLAKLLSRQQKAFTLFMDRIASCEIISKKYHAGHCLFRIVHQTGNEFKKCVFETGFLNGQDVVKKVQMILEMYSSNTCKEYRVYKEKKRQKKLRDSFSKVETCFSLSL